MPRFVALLALALQAVTGFQVAASLAVKPVVRTPTPTMLDIPTALTTLDVPMALLAKSEADELLDTVLSSVFPLGTLAGTAWILKELVGNTVAAADKEGGALSVISVAVSGFFTVILLAFAGQLGYGS